MEHGFISHSTTPYDELLRVPLIVKLPGGRFAGREVAAQVRLVDVLPTVLEAVGVEVPPEVAGCPLQPLLDPSLDPDGAERDSRCAVAVSEIAEEEGVAPIVSVRTDGWKLIDFGDRPDELYDLRRDPGERHDLLADGASGGTAEVGELAELRAVAGVVAAERARLAEAEKIELDERQIRDLKALGYLE
jgi:arylsulfatase A-like enzyme